MIQGVLFFTLFQALFLAILSYVRKDKELSDSIIGPWMIVMGLQVVCVIISMHVNTGSDWNLFSYFGLAFSTLHTPFLYLYSKHITHTGNPRLFDLKYNFILVIILLLAGCVGVNHLDYLVMPVRFLSMMINLVYGGISVYIFYTFKNYITQNFSSIDQLNVNWFKVIVFTLICYGIVILISLGFALSTDIAFPFRILVSIIMLFFVCIVFIRRVLMQDNQVRKLVDEYEEKMAIQISDSDNLKSDQESEEFYEDTSYANSGLKNDELQQFASALKICMDEKELFKNMDITLKDLANELNIYPHYITQTLNTVIGQNFYDFINSYRVEEAKKQLLNDKNNQFTILAIGFESGFSSKSSFNRIFKLKTGHSPSEFKNLHMQK